MISPKAGARESYSQVFVTLSVINMLLFMKSGGWMGLLTFLDTTLDKVFAALKWTSQNFAQFLIVDISPLRIVAADCSDLTTMYKLVSSAKRRIDAPISLTIQRGSFVDIFQSSLFTHFTQ